MVNVHKRILVPVGACESTSKLLNAVQDFATPKDHIILLNAYKSGAAMFDDILGEVGEEIVERTGEQSRKRSIEFVAKYAKTLTQRGLEVECMSETGDPRDVIIKVIKDKNIDIVALGYCQGRGLHRILMGSCTTSVLKHSPVPVIVVP